MNNNEILQGCQSHFNDIVTIRRDLHKHPETGFDVQRTAGIVAKELQELGITTRTGVGKTGVVGDIQVPGAKKRIALRADMDALPMQELADPPYKSKVAGKAHMCGHDAHTAILIGAARVIISLKDQLKVHVRFIFQPNEEDFPGGAPAMIEDGVLQDVDEIYGLHAWPKHQVGSFGICQGPALARPDIFEIVITGRGGHAAIPHLTVDPIVIGAQFVTALQSIVARSINPLDAAVVSITQFQAGTTHNVIPERVKIVGTARTFKTDVQQTVRQKIEELLIGITSAHGASGHLVYESGYPVTFNHAQPTDRAVNLAKSLVGDQNVHYPDQPIMAGEDFGYYTLQIPGCFIFLGVGNKEKGIVHSVHDAHFDIDEQSMIFGMALHAGLALSPLVFS